MNDYVNLNYYKSDVTGEVIKCAQKVHGKIGCGFQEVVYQRALALEMTKAGVAFEREKDMVINYDDLDIGSRRVDFLVDGDIMVELKAISVIEESNKAQIINYLEVYKVRIGLLINFGAAKLEVKRFIK